MMRPPFVGHRRYSITHRAVQRLRELVPGRDDIDDETLRDTLDRALGDAEDGGKAIRTLDAMLGEPQTLIPVDHFGELLYAIVKEDTVVTVLPKGHGEEILQRGQAMEQRVAAGQATIRPPEPREDDRFEAGPRRRWRKDPAPVVIERIGRPGNGHAEDDELREPVLDPARADLGEPSHGTNGSTLVLPHRPPRIDDPVTEALHGALELGRRRAAVAALREVLRESDREASLLPLWNAIAEQGLPQSLTVGDLLEAVRGG